MRAEPPSWQILRCKVRDDEVPHLEATLEELGALAITLEPNGDQAVFDTLEDPTSPLWPNCWLEALFPLAADLESIISSLAATGFATDEADRQVLADRDWHLAWRERFTPLCFAERLWIVPSWHSAPVDAEIIITLDPGMAFGTGTHPTTALCLEWLVTAANISGKQILDYGCGSGILAIAAAKLGARAVTAIDLDPEACVVARDNAHANACDTLYIGTPSDLPTVEFDVLVANILLKPVLELAPLFRAHLKPGGRIALSGILHTQVDAVLETYAPTFKMKPPQIRDDWALVTGERL